MGSFFCFYVSFLIYDIIKLRKDSINIIVCDNNSNDNGENVVVLLVKVVFLVIDKGIDLVYEKMN